MTENMNANSPKTVPSRPPGKRPERGTMALAPPTKFPTSVMVPRQWATQSPLPPLGDHFTARVFPKLDPVCVAQARVKDIGKFLNCLHNADVVVASMLAMAARLLPDITDRINVFQIEADLTALTQALRVRGSEELARAAGASADALSARNERLNVTLYEDRERHAAREAGRGDPEATPSLPPAGQTADPPAARRASSDVDNPPPYPVKTL